MEKRQRFTAEFKREAVRLLRTSGKPQRLIRLGERLSNTDTVVGSTIMQASLQGYALLKVTGRNQGLEGVRETLGARFARRAKAPEAKAA